MAIEAPVLPVSISREIDVRVMFQWNGSDWVDESANLLSATGALEIVPLNETFHGGKQSIQQATITLVNKNRRYSSKNSSSPLYTYLQNNRIYHKRCKIEIWLDGTWEPIFVGFVKRVPRESPITNQVTITIWDAAEVSRKRVSTEVLRDWHEHDVVAYYLSLAGLVDGTDYVSQDYAAAHSVAPTIDYSTVTLPFSWLDEEPVWDELVDIANSSGSKVYVNRDGRVYFEKGWRWASPYTGETITPSMYQKYDEQIDDKGFYDGVTIGYTPRVPGEFYAELWNLNPNRMISPGQTEEVEARLRSPALAFELPIVNEKGGYFLRSLNGEDLSGSCTFSPTYYGQLVKISVTNNSNKSVVLGNLKLRGQPLVGQPSEQVKDTIGTIEYNRPLEVRDNPYMMSKIQADIVKEFMKWWYLSIKTIYFVSGMRGVPTRRLMQRSTLQTPYGNYVVITTKIAWAIQVAKDKISYTQDLTLIDDVFQVSPGIFILGVDSFGSNKRLWI